MSVEDKAKLLADIAALDENKKAFITGVVAGLSMQQETAKAQEAKRHDE